MLYVHRRSLRIKHFSGLQIQDKFRKSESYFYLWYWTTDSLFMIFWDYGEGNFDFRIFKDDEYSAPVQSRRGCPKRRRQNKTLTALKERKRHLFSKSRKIR